MYREPLTTYIHGVKFRRFCFGDYYINFIQILTSVLKTMDATPALCAPILQVATIVSVKLVMMEME